MPVAILAGPVTVDSQRQTVVSNGTVSSSGSVTKTGFQGGEVDLTINVTGAVAGSPNLVYHIQEVDTGDLTTLIGSPVSSTAFTGVAVEVIVLPNTTTGAVKISWTFTGSGSLAGVYVSVGSKLVSSGGGGGGGTSDQGTPAVVANAWPVKISDGVDIVGISDVSGDKAIKVDVIQTVGGGGGGGGGTAITDKGAYVEGTTAFTPVGGVFNETITSDPTEDHGAAARITAKRALHVNLRNASGTEIGTSGAPVRTDTTGATAQPVTDNSGSLTVDTPQLPAALVSGRLDVSVGAALPAGTNVIGHVIADSGSTTAVTGTVTVSGTVTANAGTNLNTSALALDTTLSSQSLVDNATFTDGTSRVVPQGYIFDEIAGTALTENDVGAARIDSKRAVVHVLEDATTRGQRATVSAAGAVKTDGSAVTQPVSGTITANAGTNLNTSALALSATQTDRTQKSQVTDGTRDGTIKAASTASIATDTSLVVALSPNSPIPAGSAVIGHVIADSGSTTAVTGTVTVAGTVTANAGTNLNTSALALDATLSAQSLVDNAAFTDGSSRVVPQGYVFDEVAGTALTENDIAAGRVDSKRAIVNVLEDATTRGQRAAVSAGGALKVDGSAATQPVSGTVTANAGTNLNTSALALETGGNLATVAGAVRAEDAASANADTGVGALAIRKATPGNTSGTDGDYEFLQMSAGRVWTSATIDTALPAGSAVIGHVIADSGSTTAVTGTVTVAGTVTANAGTNLNTSALALSSAQTDGSQKTEVSKWIGSTAPTVGQKTMANSLPVVLASDQTTITVTGTVTETNASIGANNASIPTSSTQIGGSDGTNLQALRAFDIDTGGGTEYAIGVSLRKAASGGSVEAGTSTNPLRTDPTGATTQPVSGTVTANAGTNLNTSALALSATQTDRTQKSQVTDGTRDGTIKAASTAAIATDTSLVVALSPNSPIPTGSNVIGHVIADSGSTTAVTGTVAISAAALPLPAGAASSVNQSTEIASLASIDTSTQILANAVFNEDVASSGGALGMGVLIIRQDTPANTTNTDGDYEQPKMSAGRVWVSAKVDTALPAGSAVIGHVIADSGSTTAVTGTVTVSGTVTSNAGTNLNTSALALSATQTDRTQKTQITDGTRDGTIKAASTASIATDTSIVVALSPNSPIPAGSAVIGHVIADSGSTTAVTGTVTVSGTVTANAGTNLNTSLLALEAGGNLATIASAVRAEDAASADADKGIGALAIRKASPANTSGTDGDYEYLQMSAGRLWASVTVDTALPAGTNVIGHVIMDSGSTTAVTGTVTVSGTVTANAGTNLNTSLLALEAGGNLATLSGVVRAEDSASADADKGIGALAIRKATPANTSSTDGDYEYLQISAGRLWTSAVIDSALPAGTNVIGHIIADSGSTTAVTGTVTVAGAKTNNSAAPGATNVGTLPAVANAVDPTQVEGNQVALRTTLAGDLAITLNSEVVTAAGNLTNNAVAPAATNIGVLPAVANYLPPVMTDSYQALLSTDLNGSLRITDKTSNVETNDILLVISEGVKRLVYILSEG